MEHEQVKYTRFLSPTTCYSGLRRLAKDTGIGSLATETDTITVDVSNTSVEGVTLPRPTSMFSNLPCIGYDSLDKHQIWYFLQKKNNSTAEHAGASSVADSTTNDAPASSSSSLRYRNAPAKSSESSVTSSTGNLLFEESSFSLDTATLILWKDGSTSNLSSCLYVSKKVPLCRLLAPSLSKITCKNDSGVSVIYLVWTGCADDSELRCFQLVTNTNRRPDIQGVPLDTRSLEANFNSPIMALASICNSVEKSDGADNTGTKILLSIGCQDGTVRILELSCHVENGKDGDFVIKFDHSCSHTTIVDGPIMSLSHHLTTQNEQAILIGSMCGYVCQLKQNNETGEWEAPTMVVKDYLWDARYNADDPVLAVCGWGERNRVILGTFSGIVQVHVQLQAVPDEDSKECETNGSRHQYMLEWSCRLPYPVHAIACHNDKWVVTTRRSLHIFHSRTIRRYSADRAKYRLQTFLNNTKG